METTDIVYLYFTVRGQAASFSKNTPHIVMFGKSYFLHLSSIKGVSILGQDYYNNLD